MDGNCERLGQGGHVGGHVIRPGKVALSCRIICSANAPLRRSSSRAAPSLGPRHEWQPDYAVPDRDPPFAAGSVVYDLAAELVARTTGKSGFMKP